MTTPLTGEGAATSTARTMWHLLETVHAVVYFAPEVVDALRGAGLKGFWMGYFAGRAAPLGPASPELVSATFFNFHESMVRRALPDAWRLASPEHVLAARVAGVDLALRRLLPHEGGPGAADIAAAADLAETAVAGCSVAGRPLFAAHAALPWPTPPHLRLWHAATLLREHRGDGHVAANLAHGFDGIAAHVAMAATGAVPRSSLQPHRGWSDDEWEAATGRLVEAGLLEGGRLTPAGRAARETVEASTDRLAGAPWAHLGDATARLRTLLEPLAAAIVASGVIPFPNPMGLPRPA